MSNTIDKIEENKGITMKDMCEEIVKADLLTNKDGTKPTAKQIYNYSLTGELFMVFKWYKIALEINNRKNTTDENSNNRTSS